ncbi:30S ribosomal protein S2 [bacterium]|nr:30S ribosomal protein S2 [bacterium]
MSSIQTTALTDAGSHIGYSRTRRHPTAQKFLLGTKDRTDIFNVENSTKLLEKAIEFVKATASTGRQVLFVGGKAEVQVALKRAAEKVAMPYVAGRWVGGTLTNFKNIRGRIDRLVKLMDEREKGELIKYTKRERLMIDREIDELLARFGGLISMKEKPMALFVIDPRHEHTAVREANQLGIPVVALASSDCDFSMLQYPVPGNDATSKSIAYVIGIIVDAFLAGKKAA